MIVTIPKSTDFSNPENYHPISLICNILVRHMYILMKEHLLEFSINLSATQWSVCSHQLTVTALYSITHDCHTALEWGQDVCVIFFD